MIVLIVVQVAVVIAAILVLVALRRERTLTKKQPAEKAKDRNERDLFHAIGYVGAYRQGWDDGTRGKEKNATQWIEEKTTDAYEQGWDDGSQGKDEEFPEWVDQAFKDAGEQLPTRRGLIQHVKRRLKENA